ncbi:hypothetical protein V8C86DRAFT_2767446 [Haematococcus lacustris]
MLLLPAIATYTFTSKLMLLLLPPQTLLPCLCWRSCCRVCCCSSCCSRSSSCSCSGWCSFYFCFAARCVVVCACGGDWSRHYRPVLGAGVLNPGRTGATPTTGLP